MSSSKIGLQREPLDLNLFVLHFHLISMSRICFENGWEVMAVAEEQLLLLMCQPRIILCYMTLGREKWNQI